MEEFVKSQGDQAKKALQWVNWADNDYIAARQLLLANALVQGSGLFSTAVEKYFKALFVLLGLKITRGFKGHNICELYEDIKKKGLKLKINEEYLILLFKSYRLRYPDDLELGYNIALNRTKLLIGLDQTMYEIRKGFDYKSNNKKIITKLDDLLEKKASILLNKNCYFGNYDRAALFKESSYCYELRVLKQDDILEATYLTDGIDDDEKFNSEGLKPGQK